MASSTGPDINSYQIPDVELGDTFNTWRDTTNTSIYKLNKMRVYDGISSSSTTITVSSGGSLSVEIADNVYKGVTFHNPMVFNAGVTFNGDVTFNATTFTVNANAVTIDDYNIILGASAAGSNDSKVNAAGGGGLLINRSGSGDTAEWLWKAELSHGLTGIWKGNSHLQLVGATYGIIPHAGGILPIHGSGIRIDGTTGDHHGFQVEFEGETGGNRRIEFVRYSPSGSTAFMEIVAGATYGTRPYVDIKDGANKKTVVQGTVYPFGTPVRFDGSNYVPAQADTGDNAEVIGIVSRVVNSSTMEITFLGEIFGDFAPITDTGTALVVGKTYYLSPFASGKITNIQPTVAGTVHKALFVATGSNTAVVLPFTGGVLSSPLSISNASSVTTRINQYNRFKKGDVVRFKGYPLGTTLTYALGGGRTLQQFYPNGIFVKAQANSSEEAEVAGMVVDLAGATGTIPAYTGFDVLMDGFFDISGAATFTPGAVYFLSMNSAGVSGAFENPATDSFDVNEPSAEGSVRKPLFMATSAGSGYLYSYRGDVRGAVGGISYADISQINIQDIRSGITADLKIGVYNGSAGGRQTITIAAGAPKFASTVGLTAGYVGIGHTWAQWSGAAGNKIMSEVDVNGAVRLGKILSSTPQGQDIITIRDTGGDAQNGVTVETRVVLGTDRADANLVIGRGVRPNPGATGYLSSRGGVPFDRSALVVGASGSAPAIRWQIAPNSSANLGSAVTLTDQFSVVGYTAAFAGSVNIGTPEDLAGAQTHKPRLYILGDSNTSPRPQIMTRTTDGNLLLFNSSGAAGDYNPINAFAGGSYLVFGRNTGADAGHTFAIAPWATTTTGMFFSHNSSYDGAKLRVGINTSDPRGSLDVRGNSPNTPLLFMYNSAGGDDQTPGTCMGLRIRAGDGSGSATLLDVLSTDESTTHFAVRKDLVNVPTSLYAQTLTVGNFATTNVMPKPQTSDPNAVGYVKVYSNSGDVRLPNTPAGAKWFYCIVKYGGVQSGCVAGVAASNTLIFDFDAGAANGYAMIISLS